MGLLLGATEGGMDADFEISDSRAPTFGDYLAFTVFDGDAEIPAQISRTALVVMSLNGKETYAEIFNANRERIKEAAHEARRSNPTHVFIHLSSYNFV
jgi:hypothetical protein